MDLFQDLDDDVFTESRSRDRPTKLVSYNAKFCEKEVCACYDILQSSLPTFELVKIIGYAHSEA